MPCTRHSASRSWPGICTARNTPAILAFGQVFSGVAVSQVPPMLGQNFTAFLLTWFVVKKKERSTRSTDIRVNKYVTKFTLLIWCERWISLFEIRNQEVFTTWVEAGTPMFPSSKLSTGSR